TQNAEPKEFQEAAALLAKLPGRRILVPGNHDMAFLNPVRRVTQRLRLYRKYITSDNQPFYSDEELVVLGLNTARVSHLRNGRIRRWQVDLLEEKMNATPREAVRVLVTHHPFDLPEKVHARELLGQKGEILERVAACVDLMLAGHMHISHSGPTAERYKLAGRSAVFVQAGTAISLRARGEPNAFQIIRTNPGEIEVQTMQFFADHSAFMPQAISKFHRSTSGWSRAEITVLPAV
ncbi:MAG TPA: metallophosphoesterase, partial [Bryobacteraceae bacterium]|nr:metallophosphoesterase [Bryobacteraceae bacterium]